MAAFRMVTLLPWCKRPAALPKLARTTVLSTKLRLTTTSQQQLALKSTHATTTTSSANPLTYTRDESTTAASSSSDHDGAASVRNWDTLDLSFEDAEKAYKSKTTMEILRAYVVFTLCSSKYLVENQSQLMKFGQKIMGKRLFELFMKATFYGHFVAGEDQVAIRPVLERMRSFGVKSILDYSVEEDLSSEEAAEKEMTACVSAMGDDLSTAKKVGTPLVKEGTIKKFHAHRAFADRRYRVEGARTYFYMNEAQCERNMETFLRCIEAVSGVTNCTGFAAIKLTALGRPQLLLQLSEAIIRVRAYVAEMTGKQAEQTILEQNVTPEQIQKTFEQAEILKENDVQSWMKQMTFDESGLINVLPWGHIVDSQSDLRQVLRVPDLHTGELKHMIKPLTNKEEEMFRNMMRRIHTIFKAAQQLDSRVMVDAEQTYFQPSISRITVEMMAKYNKEKAIVFNTYQCYLKDALRQVNMDLEQAKRQKFYFGCKLVRGAYMEQERARAGALGYEDPINSNFDATSNMYENVLLECLRRIRQYKDKGDPQRLAVMVASHNEDSVRFTIQKMKELGIYPQDKVICFGQLYGMCDQVSFILGQSGYSVYKYVPYGPVGEVLPYLSRRAQENSSILTKINKERRLLLSELKRRLLRGQLVYTPKGNYQPI